MQAHFNLAFTVEMPGSLIELPRNIRPMAARAAGNEILAAVRENFRARGEKTYWMQAAESTKLIEQGGGSAIVEVRHAGVRLHLLGGVVLPGKGSSSKTGKATKLLAIPQGQNREAPLGFGSPLAFRAVKGRPHLKGLLIPAEKRQARRKYRSKPAGREILVPLEGAKAAYHLVDKTTHEPDPSVLPSQEELVAAGRAGVAELLDAITFPLN